MDQIFTLDRFKGVRVYGTREIPLFPLKDIADLCGILYNTLYSDVRIFIKDQEIIKNQIVKIVDIKGMKKKQHMHLLTLNGLYRLFYISRENVSRPFRDEFFQELLTYLAFC